MVKHQVHDEFQSFTGTSIIELSKTAADWAAQKHVAVKSLSVVMLPSSAATPPIILSLGYSDEAWYPIAVEGATLSGTGSLDNQIEAAAENIAGDVICHSLYVNNTGALEVAFLLHE
jgi:hypothetical protein